MKHLSKYNKEQFKNVYFITGTAAGGKTTISKVLAEKYNFLRYDADQKFDSHRLLSNKREQPNMNQQFKNADEFFMRNQEEYVQWLKDNTREQLKFILDDLIELSKNNTVVCDLHLTVDEANEIAYKNQIVFLIREDNENIIDDYCNRKSHEGFNRFINSSSFPEKAKENCNRVLRKVNKERCREIKKSDFYWIERNQNSTIEKTLDLIENYFGLK